MLHFILHVSDLGLKRGSGTRQLRKKSSSQRVIDKMNVWSTSFGDSYQFSIPTIWTLALHFCRIIKTFLGQWVNFTAVFKITAGQRTPSCQDDHFGMPVILTWHLGKLQEKYIFKPFRFNRASIYFLFMFLRVWLLRSSHYRVIFNILTGQKKDMTELKFLRPVNLTGNSANLL